MTLALILNFTCNICQLPFHSEEELHQHNALKHPDRYCQECRGEPFNNANNLRVHRLKSPLHNKRKFVCPGHGCDATFIALSDLAAHLEYGSRCCSGIERRRLNRFVHRADKEGVIIIKRDVDFNYDASDASDSDDCESTQDLGETWNGSRFECPKCDGHFESLPGLQAHLKGLAHAPVLYRCPPELHDGCDRQFKAFSSLLSHLELGQCGVKFSFKMWLKFVVFFGVEKRIKSFRPRSNK
ncbi:hypothetical protein BDY19DRAFT_892665 [Irpex rosettiformis]|uniref:Uncharacterized protein n=1 Tax=Irpex rosettiformis TaxID=378272 RepID=A0ACB8TZP3_9APHY|nr:hypothetical protein BDY19DRAFT_892665 [Irpex rosettiformis]